MAYAKHTHKRTRLIVQFVEYMVSGGAWFWVGYASFALFDQVLGIDFWPAKIASYIIGASVNFVLQRFWVFSGKQRQKATGQVAKRYYSLMAGNFVLDQAIVGGLREFGISPYIGQFVSSGFFTIWNWLWYSLWVFQKKQGATGPKHQHAPVLHRHKKVRPTINRRKRS